MVEVLRCWLDASCTTYIPTELHLVMSKIKAEIVSSYLSRRTLRMMYDMI